MSGNAKDGAPACGEEDRLKKEEQKKEEEDEADEDTEKLVVLFINLLLYTKGNSPEARIEKQQSLLNISL